MVNNSDDSSARLPIVRLLFFGFGATGRFSQLQRAPNVAEDLRMFRHAGVSCFARSAQCSVRAFTTGTMVPMFLLAQGVPVDSCSGTTSGDLC
jgi:hypothetical protein